MNELVSKSDIFDYTFYDDTKKLVAVLDVDYLKKLFGADIILLKEYEHK